MVKKKKWNAYFVKQIIQHPNRLRIFQKTIKVAGRRNLKYVVTIINSNVCFKLKL